jgi:hypothetical protein
LIYILACGGVELITKDDFLKSAADDDPELRAILDHHFSTLPLLSLKLIRFTTMDSIGVIYEPLVREKPSLVIYFLLVLLVISITIMNLITAVLVEHSIHMAKTDSELEYHSRRKQMRQLVPRLREFFMQLDTDCDGFVTLQEVIASDVDLPEDLATRFGSNTFLDLYEAIDGDRTGIVCKEDFVEGLAQLVLSEVPIETVKLLHYGRHQLKNLQTIKGQLEDSLVAGVAVEDLKRMLVQLVSSGAASESGCNAVTKRCGVPKEKVLAAFPSTVPSMRAGATTPHDKGTSRTTQESTSKSTTPSYDMIPPVMLERRRIKTPRQEIIHCSRVPQ